MTHQRLTLSMRPLPLSSPIRAQKGEIRAAILFRSRRAQVSA